jgi:hypothetical protein
MPEMETRKTYYLIIWLIHYNPSKLPEGNPRNYRKSTETTGKSRKLPETQVI